MGLFDFYPQGAGGLLPFNDRWAPVLQAMRTGQFDPQGQNALGMFNQQGQPQQAMAYAPQPAAPPLPPAIDIPAQTPASLPFNASASPPQAPGAMSSPSDNGGGFFERFGQGIANNPLTLMALGGGIAQGGIGRGLSAAAPFAYEEQKLRKQEASQGATYEALLKAGVPQGVALAAAQNPELLKTISPQIYTKPKWGVISEDPFGGKKYGWIDEGKQSINAPGGISGEPMDSSGTALTGPAYLEHLEKTNPSVAAGVKGLLEGNITAAGRNLQRLIPEASRVDPSFDMNTFTQRKNMATEAGKATPNSFGGQRNSGNTAIGHLAAISDRVKDLGNVDIGVFPTVSGWINWARQEGTSEQKAKANGLNDAIDRYVTEVGKFYAGSSSGGVHEREAARQRFSSYKTPKELIAAIEAERDLFHSKLQQLEEHRDTVFGSPERGARIIGPVIQPHGQEGLRRIEENIGAMRGPGPAAVKPAAPASGWTVKRVQ